MGIVQLYLAAAAFVVAGVLWFRVIRPMLEDFGVIPRDDVSSDMPEVTSSSREQQNAPAAASLSDAPAQTPDRPMIATPTPEQMLDIVKVARAAGIKRETFAPAIRGAGLPFDNNLWAQAAPPPPPPAEDDDVLVTPIAGRVTRKSYYPDDPELEFRAPAV